MVVEAALRPNASPQEQFVKLGQSLAERRQTERMSVRTIIRVAEWDGKEVPPLVDFREVETRDLATKGVSFFDSTMPESNTLVLMLGDLRNPIFVIGRVAHCQPCPWSKDHLCFVGCEFVGRVMRARPDPPIEMS